MMRRKSILVLAIVVLFFGSAPSVFATNASFQGLGDLPGGIFESNAYGVSADGSVVVGWSSSASGPEEAFRWTSGGGMVGLGDLPGGGFVNAALGVSTDGLVVVGASHSASGPEAFRREDGVMVGLGDLPGGIRSTRPAAVSEDGEVVVGYSVDGPPLDCTPSYRCLDEWRGFIWTPATGIRRIDECR